MPSSDSLDAFALQPRSVNRSLAKRLMDGGLLPNEREELRQVEQIMTKEAKGLTQTAIAGELGLNFTRLQNFTRTQKYRIYRKFLAEQQLLSGDQLALEQKRLDRTRFDAHAKNALDYFDQAYKRHPKGAFVDLDRAERATVLVAKAQGWTEPLPAMTKPKELKGGVIQAAMQAIAAADRKETVVRITQTVEIGARETAALGDDA